MQILFVLARNTIKEVTSILERQKSNIDIFM